MTVQDDHAVKAMVADATDLPALLFLLRYTVAAAIPLLNSGLPFLRYAVGIVVHAVFIAALPVWLSGERSCR